MGIEPDLIFTRREAPISPPARREMILSGCSMEHVELVGADPYGYGRIGASHYLALHDIELRDGEIKVDGLKPNIARDLRDTITFVPAGCGIMGWSAPRTMTNSYTALFFDPAIIRTELGERFDATRPGPVLYARDPATTHTIRKLRQQIKLPTPDRLYAESLSLVAMVEVFGIGPGPVAGQLTRSQLRQVRDFVEESMSREIGLADLAAAAGLSRFHFSRAFKRSTGQTPYAFVTSVRIEAARAMLVQSRSPIETIAASLGFGSMSQFRRAFQARFGRSPNAYRRENS